eukprot:CAMPEP_0168508836 /NCGR_PEP_ID=MMETSP0405-20121227/374_1 /TAXON_ID=498012 /ORGANISM="Trichosphaerium sp, Strain Am-I-7 wt" /LENGTH=168 /DNA_ID=CAMNT_0008526093 /DNA_START=51 /DNA_END=557 /DNA_ORIENTATION=-
MAYICNSISAYARKFWEVKKLPGLLKGNKTADFKILTDLVSKAYKSQKTESEAFVELVADYLTTVGGTMVISACNRDGDHLAWSMSQINNNEKLSELLLEFTSNCINPASNFKNSHGKPIPQAVYSCDRDSRFYDTYVRMNEKDIAVEKPATANMKLCGTSAKDVKRT